MDTFEVSQSRLLSGLDQHVPSTLVFGGLQGSYFNNQDLQGKEVQTRIDGPLDLKWSEGGGPFDTLGAPLSARWQGFLVPPQTGRYTLFVTGDDGVRLWINGRLLINSWQVRPASTDQVTLDLEADVPYPITLEYFDRGYDGLLQFEWQTKKMARQLVPAAAMAVDNPKTPVERPEPGLRGEYFSNKNLQGAPVRVQTDLQIDINWGLRGSPIAGLRAPLSIRWQGTITPPKDGRYTLIVTSDDGVRLFIDGQSMINSWRIRKATEERVSVDLKAGRAYPITIEYFDRGYYGVVRLEWESNALGRQIVPSSALATLPTQRQTINLGPRPNASTDLINPLRGFYRWLGNESIPNGTNGLPEAALDSYERYEWRDLERAPGVYTFDVIDRDIAKAAAAGRRHSFRVRALISDRSIAVPDYLVDRMEKGWYSNYKNSDAQLYVPDWNDSDFLSHAQDLLTALGERYNNDARVSFIDIGMYGMWGEWHTSRLDYPSPSGAKMMTRENRQRLVDMHLAAFPNKQLVMLSDDSQTLIYALRQSPRIGWRRDSLGDDHFDKVFKDVARTGEENLALLTERWKTALVVTEFINPSLQDIPASYILAHSQVQRYHISMVGNGNLATWEQVSAEQRDMLLAIGRASGYSYTLHSVSLPQEMRPGASLTLQSAWDNRGVAPTYDEWTIVWQLRDRSGRVVWEAPSTLDLRRVLPLDAPEAPEPPDDDKEMAASAIPNHIDRLSLPSSLMPDTYTLSLEVRDPQEIRRAMQLGIAAPRIGSAYVLGTLVITP